MYFLGVDGGGTKTQVILADEKGNILGVGMVGPTYFRSISKEQILETLEDGIAKSFKNAGLNPKSKDKKIVKSCFGLAGIDSADYYRQTLQLIKKITAVNLGPFPILVNDSVCALRRGTDKGYGISAVAGTGSNCYGKSKFGQEAFASGLGSMLTDEGSSTYVGQKVLHAVGKSFDGRGSKTLLEEIVCEHLGVHNVRDLLPIVENIDFGRTEVSKLAPLCEDASEAGDMVAFEILEECGKELVVMVEAVARRLNMLKDSFDLVCIGGSFKRPNGPIRKYFEKGVKKVISRATVIYPSNEPAMGAVLIAIDKYQKRKGLV